MFLRSALHQNQGQSQESLSPRALQCQRPWHAAQASRPWVQDQGESRFKAKGYGREGSNHKADTRAFSNPTRL